MCTWGAHVATGGAGNGGERMGESEERGGGGCSVLVRGPVRVEGWERAKEKERPQCPVADHRAGHGSEGWGNRQCER